jgi:uncharacterized membrane protein YfcA
MNIWIDVAAVTAIFAVGNILFGHFEERTAKWRRVLKLAIVTALTAVIASVGGHLWSAAFIATLAALGSSAHVIILRRHGIDIWTAEPRDKYYALRGWKS